MFVKLLHGLTSTIGRIKQLWTKENVPDGVQTLHDFRDGAGLVPAIPLDESSIRNDVVSTVGYPLISDSSSVQNDVVKTIEYPASSDSSSVRNDVVNTIEYPASSDSSSVRNDVIASEIILV